MHSRKPRLRPFTRKKDSPRKRSPASRRLLLARRIILTSLNLPVKHTRISATVATLSNTSREPCKKATLSKNSKTFRNSKTYCPTRISGLTERSRILDKGNEKWQKQHQRKAQQQHPTESRYLLAPIPY